MIQCPNCKVEMTDKEHVEGGYWNKCPKCGLVDDNPKDNFEVQR